MSRQRAVELRHYSDAAYIEINYLSEVTDYGEEFCLDLTLKTR